MEENVVIYLEYKMSQMIQDWKKNREISIYETFAGTFDAYLYVYGQHFIKEIEEEFHISHERATKFLEEQAKILISTVNKSFKKNFSWD